MQKINLIAQGVLELSHRENADDDDTHQASGLNYSPRRNVFRRGQKHLVRIFFFVKVFTSRRIPSLGYESLNLPKAGETFMVVWVTSKGQVVIDKDVMLLNMKEVIATKEDRPDITGPKGMNLR